MWATLYSVFKDKKFFKQRDESKVFKIVFWALDLNEKTISDAIAYLSITVPTTIEKKIC